jgi:hypothetical protein
MPACGGLWPDLHGCRGRASRLAFATDGYLEQPLGETLRFLVTGFYDRCGDSFADPDIPATGGNAGLCGSGQCHRLP